MDSKANADGSTTISGTSGGKSYSQTTGKELDLTQFGLKPYPHTEPGDGNSANSLTKSGSDTIGQVVFTTSDSAKDVLAFFGPMITSDKSEATTPSGSILGGKTAVGAQVGIVITPQGGKCQVSVTATLTK